MATIVLDPGHGGHDPGAVNGSRMEKNDNLRLGLALRNRLQQLGQNVVMTRDSDVFVSLADRSLVSNQNNADLFVSLHRNAFTNAQANGIETIVSTTPSQVERDNAQLVQHAMVNVAAQSDRGVKPMNFAVLRNTLAPAMMTELGFISNTRDNQLFDQHFNAYVNAIADAIMTIVRPAPPTPAPPPVPRPPTVFDRIVAAIQNTLNSLFRQNLRVDGVYGPQTQQALVDSLQAELTKPQGEPNHSNYLIWALQYANGHCTNAPQSIPVEPPHYPNQLSLHLEITVNGRPYEVAPTPVPITPVVDVC